MKTYSFVTLESWRETQSGAVLSERRSAWPDIVFRQLGVIYTSCLKKTKHPTNDERNGVYIGRHVKDRGFLGC
jgi:hypothetical protein